MSQSVENVSVNEHAVLQNKKEMESNEICNFCLTAEKV